jgi:hypothetical protein
MQPSLEQFGWQIQAYVSCTSCEKTFRRQIDLNHHIQSEYGFFCLFLTQIRHSATTVFCAVCLVNIHNENWITHLCSMEHLCCAREKHEIQDWTFPSRQLEFQQDLVLEEPLLTEVPSCM